jgi:hypothetical protein
MLRLQKIAGGITEPKQLLLRVLAKFQYSLKDVYSFFSTVILTRFY